ncbi:hypothetical protein DFH06DRAFT_1151950 [Mycena polygramma]|nr:hypothetical protein DFH06DRAFT_1151950 [Mycena polygramma]
METSFNNYFNYDNQCTTPTLNYPNYLHHPQPSAAFPGAPNPTLCSHPVDAMSHGLRRELDEFTTVKMFKSCFDNIDDPVPPVVQANHREYYGPYTLRGILVPAAPVKFYEHPTQPSGLEPFVVVLKAHPEHADNFNSLWQAIVNAQESYGNTPPFAITTSSGTDKGGTRTMAIIVDRFTWHMTSAQAHVQCVVTRHGVNLYSQMGCFHSVHQHTVLKAKEIVVVHTP